MNLRTVNKLSQSPIGDTGHSGRRWPLSVVAVSCLFFLGIFNTINSKCRNDADPTRVEGCPPFSAKNPSSGQEIWERALDEYGPLAFTTTQVEQKHLKRWREKNLNRPDRFVRLPFRPSLPTRTASRTAVLLVGTSRKRRFFFVSEHPHHQNALHVAFLLDKDDRLLRHFFFVPHTDATTGRHTAWARIRSLGKVRKIVYGLYDPKLLEAQDLYALILSHWVARGANVFEDWTKWIRTIQEELGDDMPEGLEVLLSHFQVHLNLHDHHVPKPTQGAYAWGRHVIHQAKLLQPARRLYRLLKRSCSRLQLRYQFRCKRWNHKISKDFMSAEEWCCPEFDQKEQGRCERVALRISRAQEWHPSH